MSHQASQKLQNRVVKIAPNSALDSPTRTFSTNLDYRSIRKLCENEAKLGTFKLPIDLAPYYPRKLFKMASPNRAVSMYN